MKTIRLTMSQALVRYLVNQHTMIDGKKEPLFPGVFAIFGHGNVTCLGEALEAVRDVMPTWRGQNEQSMGLAAVAFAKASRRRQNHGGYLFNWAWVYQFFNGCWNCALESVACTFPFGRHLFESVARSRAAAGRTFSRPINDSGGRIQVLYAFLGSHHSPSAAHGFLASSSCDNDGSSDIRSRVHCSASRYSSRGIRLSGSIF